MTTEAKKYKTVITLNKKVEVGQVMNAAGHMALGLAAHASDEQRKAMYFMDYKDADGIIHPSISAWPVIILRGKNGDIKKLLAAAKEQNMLHTDFVHTMTGGTYREQMDTTAKTKNEDLTYFGIAVFGTPEQLDPLTRKFSLWK